MFVHGVKLRGGWIERIGEAWGADGYGCGAAVREGRRYVLMAIRARLERCRLTRRGPPEIFGANSPHGK